MAGDRAHDREAPFHSGREEWPVGDERAVRALRSQPRDGLQVARALPAGGDASLDDQSRAPLSSPSATAAELVKLILEENSALRLGRSEVRKRLIVRRPIRPGPRAAPSSTSSSATAGFGPAVCARIGSTRGRPLQHHGSQPGLDRRLQGPVPDARRSLLLSAHRPRPLQPVPALLPRAARRPHGGRDGPVSPPFPRARSPVAIRSDNGAPFASTGIHGLCPQRLVASTRDHAPAHHARSAPSRTAAHERMHRTLKQACRATRCEPQPAAACLQHLPPTYNDIRPHEALGDETPASRWKPSPRRLSRANRAARATRITSSFAASATPAASDCTRVSSSSRRLSTARPSASNSRRRLWNILYYDTLLGRYDEHKQRITGVPALRGKC